MRGISGPSSCAVRRLFLPVCTLIPLFSMRAIRGRSHVFPRVADGLAEPRHGQLALLVDLPRAHERLVRRLPLYITSKRLAQMGRLPAMAAVRQLFGPCPLPPAIPHCPTDAIL
jgi:hypothetical protein